MKAKPTLGEFLLKVPGMVLGSIICSIIFGVLGFVYGIVYPWLEEMNHD